MAKKPRENRVPIMMSDEELNAIDDWRFANRIATRSDAIRRLVQMGLRADTVAPSLVDAIDDMHDVVRARGEKMLALMKARTESGGRVDWAAVLSTAVKGMAGLIPMLSPIRRKVLEVSVVSHSFREQPDWSMDELMRQADELAEILRAEASDLTTDEEQ